MYCVPPTFLHAPAPFRPEPLLRRAARAAFCAAGAALLSGCYTVNSFVDAVDANPGDGICARALTPAEAAAGARMPVRSASEARLQAEAVAKLGQSGLSRVARGDLAPLQRPELAELRSAVQARVQAPGGARPGDFTPGAPRLCTLRAAVMEANANPWKSVISVPAGTYALTLPFAAGGGSLKISNGMRIQGSGADTTIVQGPAGDSVVYMSKGSGVELNHLTLTGGSSGAAGGGMRIAAGTAELEDIIVRNNSAYSAGGGLQVDTAARVTVRRSTFSDNYSAFGGGIRNDGELWVYDSAVLTNRGNRAGGILNPGQLNLRNVTISGNWVDSPVAGVGGIWQGGFAVLNNVTITKNEGNGDSPASWQGGGIQTADDALTVMRNSIVADNNGQNGPHDCVGALTPDSRNNLIGIKTDACTITGNAATFKINMTAELDGLAFNGGTTRSHRPQADSPALNAAYGFPPPAASACEPRDQRGVPRPTSQNSCDMGAVERTANTTSGVTGFMLVNAATNTDIRPLRNDDWLVLAQLPPQLSVRATVSGAAGSVVFGFAGNNSYRTENIAPYALGGDAAGDYAPLPLGGGEHLLVATPYTAANGGGAAGPSRTIRFNVLQVN